MSSVAIVQSSYLPWWGYFHLLDTVDRFVFLDDVQYTRRDWRNRNRIKTTAGPKWITVPVATKGRYNASIAETEVADSDWAAQHWNQLCAAYRQAPGFAVGGPLVENWLLSAPGGSIAAVNRHLTRTVAAFLGVSTTFYGSEEFNLLNDPTARLVGIVGQLGATTYVSGPSARQYMDEQQFVDAGIELTYAEYPEYPTYRQPHPPFVPQLSIVDLILSEGMEAVDLFRGSTGGRALHG